MPSSCSSFPIRLMQIDMLGATLASSSARLAFGRHQFLDNRNVSCLMQDVVVRI